MNDIDLSDLTQIKRQPRVAKFVRATPSWITPSGVTGFRLIPLAVACAFATYQRWYMTAFAIVLVAALTDWFDGALAHARGEESAWGAFLDPLADKVFVLTAMLALIPKLHISFWVLFLILSVIELRLIIVRLPDVGFSAHSPVAAEKIKANNFGKVKLVMEMTALSCILVGLARDSAMFTGAGLGFTLLALMFAAASLASRGAATRR